MLLIIFNTQPSKEAIDYSVLLILTTPMCYTGQKNRLNQLLESSKMECIHQAPFEHQLNDIIVQVKNKFEQAILLHINHYIIMIFRINKVHIKLNPYVLYWTNYLDYGITSILKINSTDHLNYQHIISLKQLAKY